MREWLVRYWNNGAVRRAARAAVVMPTMFAFAGHVLDNPTAALFASFGSFAQVLFVEFTGPMHARLQGQLLLIVTGAVIICVATPAGGTLWLGAIVMAVVAFAVLFSGVVSSVLASAATPLVLAAILSISVPGPVSSIPDRLLGWGLASVASLLAITLLWPTRSDDKLRAAMTRAARAVAEHLRSGADAGDAIAALHRTFLSSPNRPTGLTTAARTLVRLVDEFALLGVILTDDPLPARADHSDAVDAVRRAAADVLDRSADLLESPSSDRSLQAATDALHTALEELESRAGDSLPATPDTLLTALEPSFRAEELTFVISLIAGNVATAAAAERRGWWERLLGLQPGSVTGAWRSAVERASAHIEWHSVWLHNSVRGAAGLALAVVVADLSGVSHGFWVVLGTLSVLRSNALATGQTIARGVLGTTIGFAIGSAVLALVGSDTTLLWVLLPIAVLIAGIAPALIGFATGQAAFTVTLLILFNLTAPAGWELGLVRLEDVGLGCAVSLIVGLLFWPRGAAATLRIALSEAYLDSARYVDASVTYAAARCERATTPPPDAARLAAAASSRRLDDTLRTYVADRGPKPTPLAEMATLVTGVATLRLAADGMLALWEDSPAGPGDRAAARKELRRRSAEVTGWYEEFAAQLAADRPAPPPLPADADADLVLIDAVRRDLAGSEADTAVRVIWTADHLDATRRIQERLVEPAGAAEHAQGLFARLG
ncbi:FUSC family protein [Cryptosporangium phraense]|uniref:FUSC family protein n=1 Tax=Cryptosporangium phraense TaxID=2593070 RepID=A0A545ASU4_9ACTN|nr:FUSC family protein [Cryptosporangium phraense]TQS44398.1 FUSC family protein [Cryptosporangium phraense]